MVLFLTKRDKKLFWWSIILHTIFLSLVMLLFMYQHETIHSVFERMLGPFGIFIYLIVFWSTPQFLSGITSYKDSTGNRSELIAKIELMKHELREYHDYHYK